MHSKWLPKNTRGTLSGNVNVVKCIEDSLRIPKMWVSSVRRSAVREASFLLDYQLCNLALVLFCAIVELSHNRKKE